ncbi:MAG: hypothetical protein QF890_03600 [Myxococcota bacterium]|jgi:hypothetical protein|nr:hypothetical protein [Deltaproteobacteria bacterium]MCP4240830.1 hypothetical protein [bacterium]MDP6074185.1 hypothetical protein [Myxococcota bacterium]MDP6242924.1 hypothetical protein [Myxococcota bacterium]MDP7073201.1 hypothetical protein [Myxococcota bacterium]
MWHQTPFALAIILGLAVAAGGAGADGAGGNPETTQHRSAEILDHIDRPAPGKGWLTVHFDHIAIHRKAGVAYTRALDLGEREATFSVRGPVLGRKKHLGLLVELRF